MQTVKSLLKKCKDTKQDVNIALLNQRATPADTGLPSPAEIMYGRPVRTTLPSNNPMHISQKAMMIHYKTEEKRTKMKQDFDSKHKGHDLSSQQ